MTAFRLEGGPFDGELVTVTDHAHFLRIAIPADPSVRGTTRAWTLTVETAEYERKGSVYRHATLIDDAHALVHISAEAFREPWLRREARISLRRQIQELAPDKVIDRVVWVLARDESRKVFSLAAVVGGRRVERAQQLRFRLRDGRGAAERMQGAVG